MIIFFLILKIHLFTCSHIYYIHTFIPLFSVFFTGTPSGGAPRTFAFHDIFLSFYDV